jgi:hypothetical protein
LAGTVVFNTAGSEKGGNVLRNVLFTKGPRVMGPFIVELLGELPLGEMPFFKDAADWFCKRYGADVVSRSGKVEDVALPDGTAAAAAGVRDSAVERVKGELVRGVIGSEEFEEFVYLKNGSVTAPWRDGTVPVTQ